jgi:hypothetical protein
VSILQITFVRSNLAYEIHRREVNCGDLLSEPKVIGVFEVQSNKTAIGKTFNQNSKLITDYFEESRSDRRFRKGIEFKRRARIS